jgi:hypothetical protein
MLQASFLEYYKFAEPGLAPIPWKRQNTVSRKEQAPACPLTSTVSSSPYWLTSDTLERLFQLIKPAGLELQGYFTL